MKLFSGLIILLITILSCNGKKPNNTSATNTNPQNSIKQIVEIFNKELEDQMIEPNVIINVDSTKVSFLNFKIDSYNNDKGLVIKVNNDEIKTYQLQTQNNVWGGKDSLQFANNLSQIKYYKYNKLLLFQIDFYPCTGLGCGVSYQIIYDLKNKNPFAFGRFRTGFDMNLYRFTQEDKTYYLSKSFDGRNAKLKDTVTYEIYELTPNAPKKLNQYSAKFMYENEEYENPKNFKEKWIK